MKQFQLDNNWKIIFGLIGLAILGYVLWIFRLVIAYVVIAAIFSFVGEPVMKLLKKITWKGRVIPSWLRAVITIFSFFALIAGLMVMFTPLIVQEIQLISSIDPKVITERLQDQVAELQGEVANDQLPFDKQKMAEFLILKAQSVLNFSWLTSVFGNLFGTISKLLVGGFSVLFISFFFLKDGFLFTRIVFTLTPDRHLEKMKRIIENTHDLLGRYFVGLLIQSIIMMTMVSLGLYFLGIENALLIGIFAGVINVVPYVGPLLSALFGIMVATSSAVYLDGNIDVWPIIYKVIGVSVVAQQIDNFIVQPLVLGGSVKAHPLEIFLVVLAAGTVGGIIGMVLAIPIYTLLRVIAKEFLSEFKVVESLTRDLDEDE
ncbi:MAG: AI-2E family transporter [Flavobacteriales bacterium]